DRPLANRHAVGQVGDARLGGAPPRLGSARGARAATPGGRTQGSSVLASWGFASDVPVRFGVDSQPRHGVRAWAIRRGWQFLAAPGKDSRGLAGVQRGSGTGSSITNVPCHSGSGRPLVSRAKGKTTRPST